MMVLDVFEEYLICYKITVRKCKVDLRTVMGGKVEVWLWCAFNKSTPKGV